MADAEEDAPTSEAEYRRMMGQPSPNAPPVVRGPVMGSAYSDVRTATPWPLPDTPAAPTEEQPASLEEYRRMMGIKPPEMVPPRSGFLGWLTSPVSGEPVVKRDNTNIWRADEYGPEHYRPTDDPLSRTVRATAEGAKAGFEGTPDTPLTAEGRKALESTPLGYYLTSPVLRTVSGALTALGAGTTQQAYEVGNAVGGPRLGRDAVSALNSIPAFAGVMPHGGPIVPGAPDPKFVTERFGEAVPGNPFPTTLERIQHAIDTLNATPGNERIPAGPRATDRADMPPLPTPAAKGPTEIPEPTPGGADRPPGLGGQVGAMVTPENELGLSPREIQAYRSTAEGTKLTETQVPGERDDKIYVKGVNPSQTEIDQSVPTSRKFKTYTQQSPELGAETLAKADRDNASRYTHYDQIGGTDVTQLRLKEELERDDQARLGEIWKNKTEANPQAVFDTADQILKGEDGRRPLVRQHVNAVMAEMRDADGTMTTDPQLLYGARKNINDYLSKEAASTDPLVVRARASLLKLKDALDSVIEPAAPGFGDYLKNHADKQGVVDANQALIDARPNLAGTDNMMAYGNVQRFMKKVVDARGDIEPNAYKRLTQDQMDQLWALRDDLRRQQMARYRASTAGSDTVQNAIDLVRSQALPTVGAAAGGAIGHLVFPFGGVGGVVGAGLGHQIVKGMTDRAAEARAYERGRQMLYPPAQPGLLGSVP